jgi:hypothetical protein
MAKYKNKTKATSASVMGFVNEVKNETKKKDSLALIELMKKKTGTDPEMWGPSIIGFGRYHYKYASGHEGDAPLLGFSPRSTALTLYLAVNFDQKKELLKKFGKHTTGKCCIYFKSLADINMDVLEKMIDNHLKHMEKYENTDHYPRYT